MPSFPQRRIPLLCALLLGSCSAPTFGQSADPASKTAPQPTPPPASATEVSTRDTATTFRVRVNLVQVRVVVRDSQGKVVEGLKKEDFQIFDNRKPQLISTFNIETPGAPPVSPETKAEVATEASAETVTPTAAVAKLPQRFVSMIFDDMHLSQEDATYVRDAATRFFSAMAPSDRVGIYTTSGQISQEFTSDQAALRKTLLGIIPRSPFNDSPTTCPDVSYYQADLIVNRNETQALAVSTEDAVQCAFNGDETKAAQARQLAISSAYHAINTGDVETEYALRHFEDILKRLATMPGQRVMVFVSPGFINSTLHLEFSELIDRATRANIVINTIDARGLYTPDVLGDVSKRNVDTVRTAGYRASYRVAAQFAQEEVLGELADGTGGTYFHNRNDVDEGMRLAGAAPPISYLLGFSPQRLKVDGNYHTLKVTLTGKQKYSVQARRGYYAPKNIKDPAEAAKEDIQEAIFSQDEIHDLPVELQTQFFKKDAAQARLSVLTRFDITGIHFRKADGRNADDLTIATAIFDENGNFVTGGEKILQMKLLDATYDRLSHSGLTVKSSFDVKPGSYMVRMVVRDAEGSQMAARNGAVVIPN